MRPLKLIMQAFGSYGKQTAIDFEQANQNLFLITGDTGAGKTTIFDAMVFALYGEASSGTNKKSGAELQSQFVEPGVQPFVELVFSEGNGESREIYTVRREAFETGKRYERRERIGHTAYAGRLGISSERDGQKAGGDHRPYQESVHAGGHDRPGGIYGTFEGQI